LCEDYYILTCRYICHGCKEDSLREKQKVAAAAEGVGLRCEEAEHEGEVDDDDAVGLSIHYTFSGWNAKSRELLPFGLGSRFPAFLTRRCAVDEVCACSVCLILA
jgi:hypothetical protein